MIVLYILFLISLIEAQQIVITKTATQQVAITKTDDITTFWYNSSNTQVAAFIFDFCSIIPRYCNRYGTGWAKRACMAIRPDQIYICITDDYWGQNCDYWGSVGWSTGAGWGYQPQSALKRKDHMGKPLIKRMSILKSGCSDDGERLVLNIENPTPGDAGLYWLGRYPSNGVPIAKFYLKDMYNVSKPITNPLKPSITAIKDMVAIANPTFEETMAAEIGFSDTNLWLQWMRFSANQHNRSNCYVCGSARPHLGTVPLHIPQDSEECFLSLFTNTSACEMWKKEYPIVTKIPMPVEGITIYPGNYTCYSNYQGMGRFLGNFSEGYCSTYSKVPGNLTQNQIQSLGNVYWICGDLKIRTRLKGTWRGECALAKVIMPLHILTEDTPDTYTDLAHSQRRKRAAPAGSFDPHVYMDAIGIPRGVPDEFKARDQVKAGFESLLPIITVNKNVDWINYIYYNQQRFVNYTKDALQGIAEQLGPTSYMTFQNRMALDIMLAEKGGVCKMIGKTGTCCTYIPDNTGPNGKVTLAIKKLEDMSLELKKNSGITDPWDQYFSWMSGWQKVLAQIGVTVLITLVLLALIVCYILPLVKKLISKAVDNSTPK